MTTRCYVGQPCFLVGSTLDPRGLNTPGERQLVTVAGSAIVAPVAVTSWNDTVIRFTPTAAGRFRLGLMDKKTRRALSNWLNIEVRSTPPRGPDHDGDGEVAITSGGFDCDDDDRSRYSKAPEVRDASHGDEDCNPAAYPKVDDDRDGHFSAGECNVALVPEPASGNSLTAAKLKAEWRCGTDCDDSNPAVVPGSVTCAGSNPASTNVCQPPRNSRGETTFPTLPFPKRHSPADPRSGLWAAARCEGGSTCRRQPNGTGICM